MATVIADEVDLTKYQAGYDEEKQRIPTPHYEVTSLIPHSVSTPLLLKLTRSALLMLKLNLKP